MTQDIDLNGLPKDAHAYIGKDKNNRHCVRVSASRSPLSETLFEMSCGSYESARKILATVLKDMGRTYGGLQ